jgi:hypothetical protein
VITDVIIIWRQRHLGSRSPSDATAAVERKTKEKPARMATAATTRDSWVSGMKPFLQKTRIFYRIKKMENFTVWEVSLFFAGGFFEEIKDLFTKQTS